VTSLVASLPGPNPTHLRSFPRARRQAQKWRQKISGFYIFASIFLPLPFGLVLFPHHSPAASGLFHDTANVFALVAAGRTGPWRLCVKKEIQRKARGRKGTARSAATKHTI
jgi:hypothetical protein